MLPSLVWMAPILNPGGYSSEAQSYAVALGAQYRAAAGAAPGARAAAFGLRQFAEQPREDLGLPEETLGTLEELFLNGRARSWDVAVCHATPDVWHGDGAFGWGRVQPCPPRGARYAVGRTMYETDRLPDTWIARINKMDEVWVPSHFAYDQFVTSGVDPSKIYVVPEAVDTQLFNPTDHKPLGLDADAGVFRFLSVFKWERRKGWDILLQAYFEEFSADDLVELHIKTQAFHSDDDFEAKVRAHAAAMGSRARTPLARVRVHHQDLPARKVPQLYKAADAFVLPTRGEGWGRPHVEAMAMGLPVIATNWSGSTEFLSAACSLPLRTEGLEDVEEGSAPKGHRWARPSVPHLRELMRWVVEHREEALAIGQRARIDMVSKFSPEAVVRAHIVPRLEHIARRLGRSASGGRGEDRRKRSQDL